MNHDIQVGVLPALTVGLVVWGLFSARLGRWNISAPIAFVGAGLLLGSGSSPLIHVSVESESAKVVTELTLAVVLFGDAATVSLRRLRGDAGLPSRLLVVGLPLTIAAGTVAAHLLLPGLSWWVCAVVGAAVAPTDAALGSAIIEDERVPARIRRLLNVESGLNDGIATPFVNFFLVAALVGTSFDIGSKGGALVSLALGAVIGAAVGACAGRGLEIAQRRGLAEQAFVPIATTAVAIGAYSLAVAGNGNAFVAAFVAGIAYRAAHSVEVPAATLKFTRDCGSVLSLVVWFGFGLVLPGVLGRTTWREVAFALAALTVVRMVPVAAALVGTGLDRATVAVVGWFGPRGLASVVFALIALGTLPAADADRVILAIGITVLLSVILHGATAAPVAGRYGASHRGDESLG